MTMDKTWVHHFQPESKEQSPKKAKSVMSAGKVITFIFWDSQGVILVDYLTKGQSIIGQYYANLLRQLQEKIKKNQHGKLAFDSRSRHLTKVFDQTVQQTING